MNDSFKDANDAHEADRVARMASELFDPGIAKAQAKTKTKRKNLEDKLHRATVQYLRASYPDLFFFHAPNGGARDIIEATKLKAFGVMPGVADILIFTNTDKYAIELKSPTGSISKSQKVFAHKWENLGGQYYVCRTLEDIELAMVKWGFKPQYSTPGQLERSKRQMQQIAWQEGQKPHASHNED